MPTLPDIERLLGAEIGLLVIAGRLCMAAILGLAIGLEREYREQPAGMRTHMLISLAAASFAVLSLEMVARNQGLDSVQVDPIRVIEAVTAGVAFLAAGSIIQSRGKVSGLTTGAGMWLAGAIGCACGVGAFGVAVIAVMLGLFILHMLRRIEHSLPKKRPDEPR